MSVIINNYVSSDGYDISTNRVIANKAKVLMFKNLDANCNDYMWCNCYAFGCIDNENIVMINTTCFKYESTRVDDANWMHIHTIQILNNNDNTIKYLLIPNIKPTLNSDNTTKSMVNDNKIDNSIIGGEMYVYFQQKTYEDNKYKPNEYWYCMDTENMTSAQKNYQPKRLTLRAYYYTSDNYVSNKKHIAIGSYKLIQTSIKNKDPTESTEIAYVDNNNAFYYTDDITNNIRTVYCKIKNGLFKVVPNDSVNIDSNEINKSYLLYTKFINTNTTTPTKTIDIVL